MTATLDRILAPVATALGAALSLRDRDGNILGEAAPEEVGPTEGAEAPLELPGVGPAILRLERPSGEGRSRMVAANVAVVLSELLEERARHQAEIEAGRRSCSRNTRRSRSCTDSARRWAPSST